MAIFDATEEVKKEEKNMKDTDDIQVDDLDIDESGISNFFEGIDNDLPVAPKEEPTKVKSDSKSDEVAALKAEIEQLKNMQMQLLQSLAQQTGAAPQGGSSDEADLFSKLGIDREEFVFDADEAIKNPESDSGKVFNHMLANTVYNVVNDVVNRRDTERDIETQKKEVARELGLTDEDMRKIEQFMSEKKLSFKDVATLYLVETGKLNKHLKENVKNDMLDQVRHVRRMPGGIAKSSDSRGEKPIEKQIVEFFNKTSGGTIFR